jgi:hypothetical protein
MIKYTRAPLTVSDRTRSFIDAMVDTVGSDGQTFFKFLMQLPSDTLRDGMIRLLLSEDIGNLLVQIETLVIQKEDAVAEQEFALAKRKREAQQELQAKLDGLVPSPIAILPEHVIQLVRDLGFDGGLPNNE